MRKKILLSMALSSLLVATVAASAAWQARQGEAKSPDVSRAKQKKLREIAKERDIEVPGTEGHAEYPSFEELAKDASAVVYGQITDSKSFFDESGHPLEHGENITTEYKVDVLRVLRERTLSTLRSPEKPAPAPLATPLKIARNGGTVYVNGHRAEVKVKGAEHLSPGKRYVFFLFWSPDYKAYVLAGGLSGVVMVNDDLTLRALASSKEIQEKLSGMDLESLAGEVLNRN